MMTKQRRDTPRRFTPPLLIEGTQKYADVVFTKNGGGTISPAAYPLSKRGTASPAATSLEPQRSFSLVEVIIAVGIFAAAVTVILALLPALTRQAASSADTLTALRLPDALRAELQRVATAGGFDALASQTKPMATPLPDTLTLVAARDATRVQALNYLPPPAADQIGEDEWYFLIEVWSFNQAPLAFDPSGAVLALHIRVSWPYRLPGSSAATLLADREQVTCNLAINR